jgi:hypothetical protein
MTTSQSSSGTIRRRISAPFLSVPANGPQPRRSLRAGPPSDSEPRPESAPRAPPSDRVATRRCPHGRPRPNGPRSRRTPDRVAARSPRRGAVGAGAGLSRVRVPGRCSRSAVARRSIRPAPSGSTVRAIEKFSRLGTDPTAPAPANPTVLASRWGQCLKSGHSYSGCHWRATYASPDRAHATRSVVSFSSCGIVGQPIQASGPAPDTPRWTAGLIRSSSNWRRLRRLRRLISRSRWDALRGDSVPRLGGRIARITRVACAGGPW